jgi:hypothetical protein
MTRLWRWIKVRKRLPSVSRSWTSTSLLGYYYCCHNIYLLLRPVILINLLLHFLLLPHPLINEESVERMVNQIVFVCYASTGMKTTFLTELGL